LLEASGLSDGILGLREPLAVISLPFLAMISLPFLMHYFVFKHEPLS